MTARNVETETSRAVIDRPYRGFSAAPVQEDLDSIPPLIHRG